MNRRDAVKRALAACGVGFLARWLWPAEAASISAEAFAGRFTTATTSGYLQRMGDEELERTRERARWEDPPGPPVGPVKQPDGSYRWEYLDQRSFT